MSDDVEQSHHAGRIEGGIDAVVIGAGADGLTAAAYLGKAGLRTVLVDSGAEVGAEIRRREFAPGMFCNDGEHLVCALDPDVIEDLDLYRHGITYAARRIDSTYFFEDGQSLEIAGDITNAAASLDEDEGDNLAFQAFCQEMLDIAAIIRPSFCVQPIAARGKSHFRAMEKTIDVVAGRTERLKQFSMASADAMLDEYFADGNLKTALLNETVFRSAAASNEAYSFMNLLRRWAGETSGLQAAMAYPEAGTVTVIDALRRAAQAAKVEIRAASPVKNILIERDCVGGVQLENGGQIRAPIVIAAMDARRVFLDMVGSEDIDIEFQRAVSTTKPTIASARLHLVLKGFAKDEKTKESMRRRLVYALTPEVLRRSFAAARAGDIPDDLVIEAIFPNTLDDSEEGDTNQLLSIMAHPLPFDENPDQARREEIMAAIIQSLGKFAPDIDTRIEASDLMLASDLAKITGAHPAAYAAKSGVMQQWALAGLAVTAGSIGGLHFCGAEAQIGPGLNCAAGRIAAKNALRQVKRKDVAA